EQRRGDSDPAPDQLSLQRNLWLDFDGRGFTIQDNISGTVNRSSRLEMRPPFHLGRISLGGGGPLFMSLPGDDKSAVELRRGALQASADSRIEARHATISAIGWDHDFQNVSASLNLPPGWRVFAISGADDVPNTWLNHWTLLEIFLVLVFSLTF